jgi:hypothetical protein
MSKSMSSSVRAAVACACAAAAMWNSSAMTAEPAQVAAVIGEQVKAEEAARASQKRIEQLDEETSKMLADYRQMTAEAQSLKGYNAQLAVQVKAQEEQLADMTRQLAEIETTAKEVLPMMNRMLETLAQFVELDVPFLPDERRNRVAQLKEMMTRPDVSTSEKYRRLVEAYQIEIEYGRTLEAYEGLSGEKTVDFLRAGRISLMYQTRDGKETGYWDAEAKEWKKDNEYRDAVKQALKVAKKQAAPDFVAVAVRAPKETT